MSRTGRLETPQPRSIVIHLPLPTRGGGDCPGIRSAGRRGALGYFVTKAIEPEPLRASSELFDGHYGVVEAVMG
jgi:hypothetical protein